MAETAFHHRDRCAIAGIGATDFSADSGRSVLTLVTQAGMAALADAGLGVDDVDGVVRCELDQVPHNSFAASMGIRNLRYWGETGHGGMAPPAMVGQAIGAILSGQATTVLVYRGLNGRSEDRFGKGHKVSATVGGRGGYQELYMPYGLIAPGQVFALIAQRHRIEHGTTAEQLGAIALACRAHAQRNPAAQTHGRPLDMAGYLASRMIASPLRLFDYCLETDGACALVVTSTQRARDLRRPLVTVRAVAQAAPPDTRPGMLFPTLNRADILDLSSRYVARTLWARAGLGPEEIDVAQIYDCFTISALLQLEAYGFCGPGEGGPFAASGALGLDGRLPTNTAGGNLSEGYIHGMNHILEGVRQMRGDAMSQVPGAETCLVTGGPLPSSSALVLRRA